jgi:peptidyl-prolyl cis-trans isomerase B (cyclophilin B)
MKRRKHSSSNKTKKPLIVGGALLIGIIIISIFFFTQQTGEKMDDIIIITTNKGTIEIQLDAKNAPVTVDNFLRYVDEGFFDGTIFHRVIDNFMIQGGGFTPNGKQKSTHAPIKLESQNGLKNTQGTIAMARTSVPDSATSQFFINTVDNDFLNYAVGNDGYAVFGVVISGMDVVNTIAKAKTQKTPMPDWPIEAIVIESIKRK